MSEKVKENAHHEWGPSRWTGLMECGRFTPDGISGELAVRGTAVHKYVETRGMEGDVDPRDMETADWCLDQLLELANNAEIEQEVRVVIPDHEDIPKALAGIFGTLDFTFKLPSGVRVVGDVKTFGVSEKYYLPQLVAYAMGIDPDARGYVFYVICGGDKSVQRTELLREDALDLLQDVADVIEGYETNEPVKCGFCEYCKFRHTCPALLGESFGMIPVVPEVVPETVADVIKSFFVNGITKEDVVAHPDKAALIYSFLVELEKRIKTAKDTISNTAKGGEVLLPGYYVGERKGRTNIVEPETIVEELVEAGVSTGDILNACSFTADALTGLHGGVAAAHIVVGDSIKVLYKEKVKKGKK
jgi:CRISPR/Cas system-associated exonuclease Cas4 (RecB family)